MKRVMKYIVVGILLLTTANCGVMGSRSGEEESYALILVDFNAETILLISAAGDTRVSDLSARFPGLYTASWSPDGQQIAFVSDQSGNREIFSMNLEAQTMLNLTQNPAADVVPSWSPDGQFIAFVSGRDYCPIDDLVLSDAGCLFWHRELYVMRRDGTDVQRVTDTAAIGCGAIRWLDNKRLIYSTGCSLADGSPTEIYTVDIDGGVPVQLTDSSSISVTLPYAYNTEPIPSPNGRQVLFNSFRDNDDELYLMNPDGTEQVRLTNMPGPELSASWSPDGSLITWEHNQEILVMNIETREIIHTDTRELSACFPAWSPDGKRIAFVADCGFGGAGLHDAVYTMNRDGSNKVNVTARLGQRRFGLSGWVPIEWMEVGVPLE